MISSMCWVPKGAAKQVPDKYELTEAERRQLKETYDRLESENSAQLDSNGLPLDLHMDDYGEDHDALNWVDAEGDGDGDGLMELEGDDEEDEDEEKDEEEEEVADQLIDQDDDDDLGSDADDFIVKDTDRMVVVSQTDDEISTLEVYLYDSVEGSLYVHHDIALPAFPLCTTWIGCGRSVFKERAAADTGNYVGVGTFKPEIEIWNLDVLDALEPSVTLGATGDNKHSDAVMGLDWNTSHQHLLASGSGDNTVKLWDLSKAECVQTFKHHTDKVQTVLWNPVESTILLTGSFDKSICLLDAKTDGSQVVRMNVTADVESCAWNPFSPNQVAVSTEDGRVTCFDVRNTGAPLYTFMAHDKKPCSSISFHKLARGVLASCSPDKSVKVWDLESARGPSCIASKVMAAGALFTVAFGPDDVSLLGTGGDKGLLALWDISEDENVGRLLNSRIASSGTPSAAAPPAAPPAASEDSEVATSTEASSGAEKSGKKKGKKGKKSKA